MRGLGRTLLGLATLALLCGGGWYLLNLFQTGNLNRGEIRVNLRFNDAHGVPVGGAVRHKGVSVGQVLKVDVAPDDSGVIMEIALQKKFHHTIRKNSRFWIVRPRFGGLAQGIFGLDTLIKDPYVEFDTPDLGSPLLPSGSVAYGLAIPPVAEDSLYYKKGGLYEPLKFKVRLPHAPGLSEGAPVLYRDVTVGKVVDLDLSVDGRSVEVELLLEGRYRETARTDSVFWVAKPNVQVGFNWPSLVSVKDLSKILTGAAISYATPTDSQGKSLRKGVVLDGADEPPDDLE